MTKVDEALESVLEGYASFLRERMLAPLRHQPYLVRWVQEFLLFAEQHRGYTFEQTLELFLAALGERVSITPWQIQQAADALRIYRYQYRADASRAEEARPTPTTTGTDEGQLARLQEVIRPPPLRKQHGESISELDTPVPRVPAPGWPYWRTHCGRCQGLSHPSGHGREGERFDTESGVQRVAASVPGGLAQGPGRNGTDSTRQARAQITNGTIGQRGAGLA